MRSVAVLLILIGTGCGLMQKRQLNHYQEERRIANCREWTYYYLTDTLEIELLILEEKGRYHMGSWPNFFIGVNSNGDTVGVTDRLSSGRFKRKDKIRFLPFSGSRNPIDSDLYPLIQIKKRKSQNDLYCAVKKVYYAEFFEKGK